MFARRSGGPAQRVANPRSQSCQRASALGPRVASFPQSPANQLGLLAALALLLFLYPPIALFRKIASRHHFSVRFCGRFAISYREALGTRCAPISALVFC